jgi:hypothetical protein
MTMISLTWLLRILLASLIVLAGMAQQANAAQVTFAWDTPTDKTGIVGYFLGCGPSAGNHGTPVKQPGANTSTGTLTLAPGTWYCAVWSYGAPDTLVSVKSNEPQVPVPLGAPNNLRFTVTLVWDRERGVFVAKAGPVREIE